MASASEQHSKAGLDVLLTRAMRGLAKSVVLISTADGSGQRHVMVATAVTPISMAPPSMLMCVNRNVSSYPTLLSGSDFCVNILRTDHLALAQHCSSTEKGEARFRKGAWALDVSGTPYLTDALAAVICCQDKRVPYGSHDVFMGRVRDVHVNGGADPLVYVDGTYTSLQSASTGF